MSHQDWLSNVVLAAGKPYAEPTDIGFSLNPGKAIAGIGRSARRVLKKVHKTTTGALKKIPVVGAPLTAVWNLTPIGATYKVVDLAGKICDGERIDKAVYESFKNHVKDIRTVAPYVLAIVGTPALGAGAEALFAGANALAKGMQVAKPVVDGVRQELGKSPAALKAFDTTVGVFDGVASLGSVDPGITKAVGIMKGTMEGKAGTGLDAVLAAMPKDEAKGVKTALTMLATRKIQEGTRKASALSVPMFFKAGNLAKEKDSVLKLAHQELRHKPEVQKGFNVAVGLLSYKANPTAIIAARDALEPEQRKGFDIGSSIRVGQLSQPLPPSTPPREKLGYYLTKGSEGLKPEARKQILQSVKDPVMVKGVRKGLKESDKTLWQHIVEFVMGKSAIEKAA